MRYTQRRILAFAFAAGVLAARGDDYGSDPSPSNPPPATPTPTVVSATSVESMGDDASGGAPPSINQTH